jgi:hypothetical protein
VTGRADVNGGWVGRSEAVNAAGQHFVDLGMPQRARSTFFPYSQHFVDLPSAVRATSTKCCLIADRTLTLPTQRS